MITKDNVLATILMVVFIILAFGYGMNIADLIEGGESAGLIVARIIGIFFVPPGSILGLFV